MSVEDFGEKFDRTRGIKGILEGYTFSHGILREILQNSDDAKAQNQTFIIDYRFFDSDPSKLVDPFLVECQGPALFAINDTQFQPRDWEAIRTIHSSSKLKDESTTGKYGLGFRSCYHITDYPHILSGSKLAIFDPHETCSAFRDGGGRVDFVADTVRYSDQLAAFNAAVSDTSKPYEGTVIRLPLRTPHLANQSRIKKVATTLSDVEYFFDTFIEQELSIVMLFLKHITRITLKRIQADGRVIDLATAWIDKPEQSAENRRFIRTSLAETRTFTLNIKVQGHDKVDRTTQWHLVHFVEDDKTTRSLLEARFGQAVDDRLQQDKLFPHVALAAPIPASQVPRGRLFTLLPLPIETQWPVHAHAILALTSDRQNLRKIDSSLVKWSRDEFLVDWNQTVFEGLMPGIWAKLLEILVATDSQIDIFKYWPIPSPDTMDDNSRYWASLAPLILKVISSRRLATWPTFASSRKLQRTHVRLDQVLVTPEGTPKLLLEAITSTGVLVSCLPPKIFEMLSASDVAFKSLQPNTLHAALLDKAPTVRMLRGEDKNLLLDYLLTGSILNIIGLEIIPVFGCGYGSVYRAGTGEPILLVPDENETRLFWDRIPQLIDRTSMAAASWSVIWSTRNEEQLNLRSVGVEDIRSYLYRAFGVYPPGEDEATGPSDLEGWLCLFWDWMNGWSEAEKLWNISSDFHILPTSRHSIRQLSASLLDQSRLDDLTKAALAFFNVPCTHPDLAISSTHILRRHKSVRDVSDLGFILDQLTVPNAPASKSGPMFAVLQKLFVGSLDKDPQQLNDQHTAALRKLPIFPALEPPATASSRHLPSRTRKSAFQKQILHIRSPDYVLPVAPHVLYIELSHPGTTLARAINPSRKCIPTKDWEIISLILDSFSAQPNHLVDHVVQRLLSLLSQPAPIPPEMMPKIEGTPFILVGPNGARKSPNEVVDPYHPLKEIFLPSDYKVPILNDTFTAISLLTLRSHRLLPCELSPSMIVERIHFFSSPTETKDQALALLNLLKGYKGPVPPEIRSVPWLPVQADSRDATCSVTAASCRDEPDAWLCDQVLRIIPATVSDPVREMLGWEKHVPLLTVQRQMLAVLDGGGEGLAEALIKLIIYLATKFADGVYPSSSMIDFIGDREWIPISKGELIRPRFAFFDDVPIGLAFRRLPQSLRGGSKQTFLLKMGCTTVPSADTLLDELVRLSRNQPPPIDAVSSLLSMIARHTLTPEQRARVVLPDYNGLCGGLNEIFYDDSGLGLDEYYESYRCCHPAISKSIAHSLGMINLSDVRLTLDADDSGPDDFEYEEDLTTRINNVLSEHSVEFSSNEFVANAIDAGASDVSFILDEKQFTAARVLAPKMADFQHSPSLLIHNDALFTEKDFAGIRRVGRGGKTDEPNSIGRFGEGALSLFYFTEMVMLISGNNVAFLDPGANYLPSNVRHGGRRRGLRKSLRWLESKYPEYLHPFEGIFNYQKGQPFPGTVFRLPLRSSEQAAMSPLSSKPMSVFEIRDLIDGFWTSATMSFFFTSLRTISATHRTTDGSVRRLWAVSAEHFGANGVDRLFQQSVRLTLCPPATSTLHASRESTQLWLITSTSEIFPEFADILEQNHLPSLLQVKMAAQVTGKVQTTSNLFSTLPLPIHTTLPVHIHAPWIIPPNRQSIPFYYGHGPEQKTPQGSYNAALLDKVAPPLYLFTIARVGEALGREYENQKWWPKCGFERQISTPVSIFLNSLYRPESYIQKTMEPVCRTAVNSFIRPSLALFSSYPPNHAVTRLLRNLKLRNYVDKTPQFPTSIISSLQQDTALAVRNVLKDNVAEVITLWNRGQLTIELLDDVIRLLMDGDQSFLGLPLLPLQNGDGSDTLVAFQNVAVTPVFFADRTAASLFAGSRFISDQLSHSTRQVLADQKVFLCPFDKNAVLSLLINYFGFGNRDVWNASANQSQWITRFWDCFSQLPVTQEDVDKLPLLQTRPSSIHSSGSYISIHYAKDGPVLGMPPPSLQHLLVPMQTMGIFLLDAIPKAVSLYHISFDLERFLHCVEKLRKRDVRSDLTNEQWGPIAMWIRTELPLRSNVRSSAVNLPIWESVRGDNPVFEAAADIVILPQNIQATAVAKFMPSVSLVEYSDDLARLFPSRVVSGSSFIGALTRPDSLNLSDMDNLLVLLELMRALNKFPWIPDGTLTLRDPSSLYDHNNPIFSSAFARRTATAFVHEALRSFNFTRGSFPWTSGITKESFRACAQAIEDETRSEPRAIDLIGRAQVVADCFFQRIAPLYSESDTDWEEFSTIAFIPRNEGRLQDRDITKYGIIYPSIVCVNDLVREEFVAVTWTQRARFLNPPQLARSSHRVGVPGAEAVVRHLAALALTISKDHHHDYNLWQDLRATYQWLDSNVDESREHLLSYLNLPIFLNVDQFQDPWEWRCASELVLNLWYDEGGKFRVLDSLHSFTRLLSAAGVEELKHPKYTPTPVQDDTLQDFRSRSNEFRTANKLTDLKISPKGGSSVFEAHRFYLAVTIPHLESLFLGDFKESTAESIELPVSEFCLRFILEYVYTGDIEHLIPTANDSEESERALEDLGDLLETAEIWELPKLKELAANLIIQLKLVRLENVNYISKIADRYNVENLSGYCNAFRRENASLLCVLGDED